MLLLKYGADDLYGQWKICELKIMGLIQPATLIGKLGLTADTVEPFGLKPQYFYDQMQFANGIGHVFNYYFHDDVADFFAALIREALAN